MWMAFSFKDTMPNAGVTNRLKQNFVSFAPELNKAVSGPAHIMQKELNVKNCQPGNNNFI